MFSFKLFALKNLLRTRLPIVSAFWVLGEIQSLKLLLGELCLPLNLLYDFAFPVCLGIGVDNTDYKKMDIMIPIQLGATPSFNFLDIMVQAQECELCTASSCHILMLKLWISQSLEPVTTGNERFLPVVCTRNYEKCKQNPARGL